MFDRSIKLAPAIVLLAAAPALAGAQNVAFTTSPVAITSFALDETFDSGIAGGELERPPEFHVRGIALRFVNTSSVTATSVTFVLRNGGTPQRIVDAGTFARGISIDHRFPTDTDADVVAGATCTVAEVDFADGTRWRNAADIGRR